MEQVNKTPKSASFPSIIIAVCMVISTIARVWLDILMKKVERFPLPEQWPPHWGYTLLFQIRDIGWFIAISGILIWGIIGLRQKLHPKKAIFLTIVGALLFLMHIGASVILWKGADQLELAHTSGVQADTAVKQMIEAKLKESDFSMEDRSALSRLYAAIEYKQTGKILDYWTPDGKLEKFKPAPGDDTGLQLTQHSPSHTLWMKQNAKHSAAANIILFLAGIGVGLLAPLRKSGRTLTFYFAGYSVILASFILLF